MITDTIAAISTGMAPSGIGKVRLSGDSAIDIVDKMFITEIDAEIEGDTYFPEFNMDDFEREVECHVDGDMPYDYVTYTRKKA